MNPYIHCTKLRHRDRVVYCTGLQNLGSWVQIPSVPSRNFHNRNKKEYIYLFFLFTMENSSKDSEEEILSAYNKKMERKHFESKTLEKYKMESADALFRYLQTGKIINIGVHPEHNETQKKLSNLYHSPFTLDGERYESVEAFRVSIKYPENDSHRKSIRKIFDKTAKEAVKDVQNVKVIQYQGNEIQVGSEEHHQLLKRALRAKLERNPWVKDALIDTGDKKLVHIIFTRHEDKKYILHDSETIPGEKFAQLYTELRDEFRSKKLVPELAKRSGIDEETLTYVVNSMREAGFKQPRYGMDIDISESSGIFYYFHQREDIPQNYYASINALFQKDFTVKINCIGQELAGNYRYISQEQFSRAKQELPGKITYDSDTSFELTCYNRQDAVYAMGKLKDMHTTYKARNFTE